MRGGARPNAGRKPKVADTAPSEPQLSNGRARQLAALKPFKPGAEWTGNRAGRPKGSRNKLGEEFLSALQADFEQHGEAAITEVRQTRPHEYLKVIAGILPKELKVTTGAVEELSDDELAGAIATLQSVLAAQAAREGSEAPGGSEQAPPVSTLQ